MIHTLATHPAAIVYLCVMVFIFIFAFITQWFQMKYGCRKVDKYVKDLFTPDTILMLRKLEK